ncbi:MAG: Gfo/Idh/MocA family oxidoreductase [Actinomycetota bacterium]|nr:Gfo/Idh/MocA family oxidoreductase [Actinomycetota bacterium]
MPSSMDYRPSRRTVLRSGALLGAAAGLGVSGGLPAVADEQASPEPPRTGREGTMTNVAFEGFDEVRVALLGVGNRGMGQARRWAAVSTVTAIADIRQGKAEEAADRVVAETGQARPALYTNGEEDYLNLLRRDDIDLVYVATPWEWHYPMAKAAMEHGKHVSLELPIAPHLDEIWDLVRTSELTRKHCMLLENVCYFRPEMRVLMMAEQGLFGELLHGSGGYIHDLRNPYMFHGAYYPEGWRRQWHTRMNASHYPMHGLGPVSAAMDVNRGDRFDRLVAIASPSRGLALYRKENMSPDHPSWGEEYISGDRHEVFIQTVGGRFIRSDHQVVTPHPYSRGTTLVGTRGVWDEHLGIYLETLGHTNHSWRAFGDEFAEYDHWLWQDIGGSAEEYGGHGGGDFISIFRTIQLMRLGLTPDIDVYDSASWCSVIPLSEKSLEAGSLAVQVPDFTRGHWEQERPGLSRGRPESSAQARRAATAGRTRYARATV